jgi:dienelactone hydrolase
MKTYFSPSVYHQQVMKSQHPAMSFQGGNVQDWQRRARLRLRKLLGDRPRVHGRLHARTLWKRAHDLGTIEKIVFTAEPGADVACYACLPRDARPPYRFMICLQGHTTGMHLSIGVTREDETKPMPVEGDRDFALGCLRRGYAALCIEQRAFGERREQVQRQRSALGCFDAAMQALMLGRTLIGERVYDVERALDYLESRGDADLRHIGIMGHSAGGATSLYTAALLPRIAYAMPSGYFCTFRESVMAMHHCEENYLPGLLRQFEMADIAGLIAPRPLVLVAGRHDPSFPITATRRAFRHLQSIYAAAGAANRCRLVVGLEGHRFYADRAWPVLQQMKG